MTINERPPLAGVRFLNAVPDGGAVDIRYIDQVEWSGSSVNGNNQGLAFRAATHHWPTEAKARRIRVFPSDSNITVASQILHDTTISIVPNKNITLMLVGSRVSGGVRFVEIDDSHPTLTGQQIAVRVVNAGGAGEVTVPANGYITATTTSAIPTNSTWDNIGAYGVGSYVVRDTGAFAVRTTGPGGTPIFASSAAPTGAPAGVDAAGNPNIGALAGARGAGTAMSAYLFPRAVAGAPGAPNFTTPGLTFFIDRAPPPPRL